jgi:hypothetical protein
VEEKARDWEEEEGKGQLVNQAPLIEELRKTSYTKAMLQKRLLDAIRHGWKSTGKKAVRRVARPGR